MCAVADELRRSFWGRFCGKRSGVRLQKILDELSSTFQMEKQWLQDHVRWLGAEDDLIVFARSLVFGRMNIHSATDFFISWRNSGFNLRDLFSTISHK